MTLSPIVLFVYNRPWHTQQTIEALQKNELASESELFIFSDAAKNETDVQDVIAVRNYIKDIDGFRQITIIERETNWGLASSIISGVTDIVNKYGKIVVLEDDLVTSPYFLKFMNEALEFYKNEKKVWHISGWNYPIDTAGLEDVFLWRLMNCWGWATWADKWQYFEKDVEKAPKEFTKNQIKYLNLDGYNDAWSQIIANKKHQINTWAIYWYACIVKNQGLCLNPSCTYVSNIGLDGSGVHCGKSDFLRTDLKTQCKTINFNTKIIENSLATDRIKEYYKSGKKNILSRVINKLSRVLYAR